MATPYAKSPYFTTSNQYILYDIWVDIVSQDIVTNTSVVRVRVWCWRTNNYRTDDYGTCYVTVDGQNFSNSWEYGQKPIYYNSDTLLFDGNVTVNHNADGKKTIYVSSYIRYGANRFYSNSQGFNVELPTIPRQATITTAPNFNDIDNPVLQYSNPAGNIVSSLQACISLDGTTANIAYRDISKTGTSYTFELSAAERNILLAACPNSNTLTVYFRIKTVLEGVTYYSTQAATMSVVNANPTITGATYQDTNAATTAITGDNQKIIQNNSTVRFDFAALAALKYATLSRVEITVNAVTVTGSLSGTAASNVSVSFGTINSSRDLSAMVKLFDSRGNSTSQEVELSLLAWELPTAIITCARKNNYYSETDLTVDALYSSLNGENTITIQYQYKEVSSSSWSALTAIQDNVTETVTLDNTKQWNVRVIVTDRIGSTTYNLPVDKGIPLIFFDRLNRSVGVNRIPLGENSLETDGFLAFGGFWLSSFRTQGGQAGVGGYVRAATIQVKEIYANAPIEFKIFRRRDLRPVTLYLTFENSQYTDPNVAALKIDSLAGISSSPTTFSAFIYKTGSSTWDLYVIKSEDWDDISIQTSISNYMFSHVNVNYEDDLLTAKPAGAIDAVVLT